MKVGFIGLGKLGLPVALAIESKGYKVCGYDVNHRVAQYLRDKEIPFREKDLQPLLDKNQIEVLGSIDEVVRNSDIIFCPVQTPHHPKFEGRTRVPEDTMDFDYQYLVGAVQEVAEAAKLRKRHITLVVISTCLPGTYKRVIQPLLNEYVNYVYNPFFIAMGTVLDDFLNPEYVLIGRDEKFDTKPLEAFYKTLHDKPHLITDITTAEAIKVSYNTYITMKTVLANTWGEIAHKVGANVDDIYKAWSMSTDRLMSPKYLKAGMGDGGGCHPRDNTALADLAKRIDLSHDIFTDLMLAREHHTEWLAGLVAQACEQTDRPARILGRAFKPETDIETGSPAMLMLTILEEMGVNFVSVGREAPFHEDDEPKVYFLATAHQGYLSYPFADGSIIIDPFGMIADRQNCLVLRLGRA